MVSIDYCFKIINYSVNICNGDAHAMLESWGRGNLQIISIAVIKLIQGVTTNFSMYLCACVIATLINEIGYKTNCILFSTPKLVKIVSI